MLQLLKGLCLSKKMCSIYINETALDKFRYGTIIAVNEKEVAIQMVSPDGEEDGIMVIDIEQVIRIETDGQYDAKMKKLCLQSKSVLFDEKIDDTDIFGSFLSFATAKKAVVSIELSESGCYDIVGIISRIQNDLCEIRQFDEYGFEDGISYVSIHDITTLCIMSEDEKRICRLIEMNMEKTLL